MTSSGRRIAAAVVTFLASCCLSLSDGLAADACDRLLRQWIDEFRAAGLAAEKLDAPFRRLAEIEKAYGRQAVEAVDTVFQAAESGKAPRLMEQFLELRSAEEANIVFANAARFEAGARRGVAKAAGLSGDAGANVHKVMAAGGGSITDVRKERFFSSLDELSPQADAPVPGTDRLLKRAGDSAQNNDIGGLFEGHANAELSRSGQYGRVREVDYDRGGAGSPRGDVKIDTLTETHAVQVKSKANAAELDLGTSGVPEADLLQLVNEARQQAPPVIPALMSNVPFSQGLQQKCADLGIVQIVAPF